MQIIGAVEAGAHFSELLHRVARGEEFLVTKDSEPVAQLTRVGTAPKAKDLDKTLAEIAAFRAERAKLGPVLNPGETWKDLARGEQERSHKAQDLEKTLAKFAAIRAAVAKRGSVLKPGETLRDMAREGLKW